MRFASCAFSARERANALFFKVERRTFEAMPMLEPSSKLGFGCARLLERAAPRRALTLLEFALDHGISHFDVARSYGDGRAETVIGALAKRRRREMTIVTKAGLAPPTSWARAARNWG